MSQVFRRVMDVSDREDIIELAKGTYGGYDYVCYLPLLALILLLLL